MTQNLHGRFFEEITCSMKKCTYLWNLKKNPFYFKTTWAQHKTYALNYIVTFKKTLSMSLPLQEMTTTQLQMESL